MANETPVEKKAGGPAVAPVRGKVLKAALALLRSVKGKALLVYADALHDEDMPALKRNRQRILLVTRESVGGERPAGSPFRHLPVPNVSMSRSGQMKAAMLVAVTRGMLGPGDLAVCVAAAPGSDFLDNVMLIDVSRDFAALFDGGRPKAGLKGIRPEVFERVVSLASRLGTEGREGKPVGAIFVVGDAKKVMGFSRPMILNPFQGYSDEERNILDPRLEETVKGFSTLDGAFIVRGDGVLQSAGAFLAPAATSEAVPLGLGARHQAAAAMTLVTDAVAVALSQSTGVVTVFRRGQVVTELETRARSPRPAPPSS